LIGTSIGSYEIHAALGAGGMGEVYRARDSKLGRDVALKILPQTFASDPERVARFRREAQLLAALNHPHIGAIHGLEDLNGVPVLVLELVEGPTLADRLEQGPIPASEAFAIARQIASALETAHEHSIIHRDLKPANVKLRTDGVVKVLDFGLAKALDAGAGSKEQDPARAVTASPTITSPAMTRIGMIMGTASYMSPEQARGRTVDRGADVWAWGCVLFEMLAGRRAFDGADTTDVIAAVVRGEPEWSRLPPDTPGSVRRLLRRCLEKDPRQRIADLRDARFALEDLATEPAAPSATPARPSRERLLWAAALLLCIAGGAAMFWRGAASTPTPRELRVEITTSPTTDLVSFTLSPDGDKLAYVASSEGRPMLWVRSLTTGHAAPLAGTEGPSFPFWSPDSRSIGFFANDRLYRIGLDGGSLRELASAPVGTGGTWNREGVILFTPVPDGPVLQISDTGGPFSPAPAPTADRIGTGGNRFPQFLPDGRRYLYFMAEASIRGVYVGTLDGPERRRLFDADGAAVLMLPSSILFLRADTLYLQRFDPTTLILDGEAVPIASGIIADSTGAIAASASPDGSIAFRTGSANRQRRLAWFDRAGTPIGEPSPADSDNPINPVISPGGSEVMLSRTVGGVVDIWLQDLLRVGARTKVTSSPTPDISPVWSPDGRRVAYGKIGKTGFDIWTIQTSGGNEEQIFDGPNQEIPVDWSPDGRFLLFRSQSQTSSIDLWALPLTGSRTPFPIAQSNYDERSAQVAPDGAWIAIESNESGAFEIYVQSFPTPTGKAIVSTGGGRQPRWGPDSRELFYVAPDGRLMSVALTTKADGQGLQPATPLALFAARIMGVPNGGSFVEYDASRDGKRFLLNTLVEHSSPITLILNATAARQ
jgi:eukaryotic-like serine/threonine-protein kinase